jgi:hypothetical protein
MADPSRPLSTAEVDELKVSELRSELAARGVDATGLRVKAELRDRLVEHLAESADAPAGSDANVGAAAAPGDAQVEPVKAEVAADAAEVQPVPDADANVDAEPNSDAINGADATAAGMDTSGDPVPGADEVKPHPGAPVSAPLTPASTSAAAAAAAAASAASAAAAAAAAAAPAPAALPSAPPTIAPKPLRVLQCEQAVALDRYDVDSWRVMLGHATDFAPVESAIETFESFLRVFPSAGRYWKQYSALLLRAGDRKGAENVFRRSLPNIYK